MYGLGLVMVVMPIVTCIQDRNFGSVTTVTLCNTLLSFPFLTSCQRTVPGNRYFTSATFEI